MQMGKPNDLRKVHASIFVQVKASINQPYIGGIGVTMSSRSGTDIDKKRQGQGFWLTSSNM